MLASGPKCKYCIECGVNQYWYINSQGVGEFFQIYIFLMAFLSFVLIFPAFMQVLMASLNDLFVHVLTIQDCFEICP